MSEPKISEKDIEALKKNIDKMRNNALKRAQIENLPADTWRCKCYEGRFCPIHTKLS